ncbi:MAG: hypothetical protein NT105_00675 [Verrucomicrobia bacterium]|nr:hypothetical protein [Verrucomicrobiota bacterium]
MKRALQIVLTCLVCNSCGFIHEVEEIQTETVQWTSTVAHLAYRSGSICDAKKATQDYISALEKLLPTKQQQSEVKDTRQKLAWAVTRLAMIEEALGHSETAEQVYQRAAKAIAASSMENTKLEDLKRYIESEPYYDAIFGPVLKRAKLAAWKERKGDWEKTTVELHSTKSAGTKRVAAKQCSYKIRFALGRPDIGNESLPITVFVTDSGETWAGPEQDFYIETDSGIVGGTVDSGLLWCDSLVTRRAGEKDSLDILTTRFDKQVGGYDLGNARRGWVMDGDGYSDSIMRGRYTFFRDSLGRDFDDKVVESDGRAYRAVQVTGNTLRLEMRGRGGACVGSVSVSIKSREVLNCSVDRKQVSATESRSGAKEKSGTQNQQTPILSRAFSALSRAQLSHVATSGPSLMQPRIEKVVARKPELARIIDATAAAPVPTNNPATIAQTLPTNDPAWSRAVNLMPLIDPAQNRVGGNWSLQGGALVSDNTTTAKIQIPYLVPAEYDFRIVFNCTQGRGPIIQMFSQAGRAAAWVIGAGENTVFGFDTVGGKN